MLDNGGGGGAVVGGEKSPGERGSGESRSPSHGESWVWNSLDVPDPTSFKKTGLEGLTISKAGFKYILFYIYMKFFIYHFVFFFFFHLLSSDLVLKFILFI